MAQNLRPPTHLIACGVFRPALEWLQLERKYPEVSLSYLPSNLHLRPQALRGVLSAELRSSRKRDVKILCLYGSCFPDIDTVVEEYGAIKIPGGHCYEMLLGSERYQQVINEKAGTYFLERDLILNFNEYCLEPLELHDRDTRKSLFSGYCRLMYIRQPTEPDLRPKASELADFLELPLEIVDADYSYLEESLIALIGAANTHTA